MNKLTLHCLKNGGDSASIVLQNIDYRSLQNGLAKAVQEHISTNPVDQPIAEVLIRWKAPVAREYRYTIYDETTKAFLEPVTD